VGVSVLLSMRVSKEQQLEEERGQHEEFDLAYVELRLQWGLYIQLQYQKGH